MRIDSIFSRSLTPDSLLERVLGKNRFVLYGAGKLGAKCAAILEKSGKEVLCFIDGNCSRWYGTYQGKDLLPPEVACGLFKEAVFVSAVWAPQYDYHATQERLERFGAQLVIPFQVLIELFDGILPYYQFERLAFYNEKREKIERFYSLLCDDRSREIYADQLKWRMSLGTTRLMSPTVNEQYFPSGLHFHEYGKIFIDCGAYDGDTLRALFTETWSNIECCVAIEPDPINYEKLSMWVAALPGRIKDKIITIHAATGALNGRARISAAGGTASSVSIKGEVEVEMIAIDSLDLKRPATYLKMDVEGAEMETIIGARNTIANYSPSLAVCVYHKPEDIFDLGLAINELNGDYKFYLRAHCEQGLDLILYAVPGMQ